MDSLPLIVIKLPRFLKYLKVIKFMLNKLLINTFLFALIIVVSGCSSIPFFGKDKDDKDPDAPTDTSEQVLYKDAQRSLRTSNYKNAISKLQFLESRFPFGRYAEQAQLELIFAHYSAYGLEEARTASERFIRLHPQHSNVDYAFYMKGLASFDEGKGIFDRLKFSDSSKRDMTHARLSFADFSQLLSRFPNSPYAPDARQRMIFLRNLLAESELEIASYYVRRGALVAATTRAAYVVENYSQSESVADALAMLVEINWRLGLDSAAQDSLKVLALNYPDYKAFDNSGKFIFRQSILNRDRSWTNIITLGLLDRPNIPAPITIE